jgi:CRP/FNR family transcriptional regulator
MTSISQLAFLPGASNQRQVKCASCALKESCLPMGLDEASTARFDKIIVRRRRLERDDSLFQLDQPFASLYVVHFGHFKTFHLKSSGEQQVVGFPMAGDLLGMDAIDGARHFSNAVALADSEVCEIPLARLEELSSELPQLQRNFNRTLSRELAREQNIMMLLGRMRGEQRFAMFVLNLSQRYAARGYSPTRFILRMSREDIGNYLGMTIESVCRLLRSFRQKGWLQVAKRVLEITDLASIEALARGLAPAEPLATRATSRALSRKPAPRSWPHDALYGNSPV